MTPIFVDIATTKAQIARLRAVYPELEEDAQLLEDTLEGDTDFRELLTKLVRLESEAISFMAAVTAQERQLAERRRRFVRRSVAYRDMMLSLLEAASQTKVELPEATISIARDRAGCIITDETALPDAFVKTERTPRKADILAELLSGNSVPGAELKNSGTHLAIRV